MLIKSYRSVSRRSITIFSFLLIKYEFAYFPGWGEIVSFIAVLNSDKSKSWILWIRLLIILWSMLAKSGILFLSKEKTFFLSSCYHTHKMKVVYGMAYVPHIKVEIKTRNTNRSHYSAAECFILTLFLKGRALLLLLKLFFFFFNQNRDCESMPSGSFEK